jgi:hypothetical protein
VRELEARVTGSYDEPAAACMLPQDAVAAAQLAARLNLSVDDAVRALVVKRQARRHTGKRLGLIVAFIHL